MTLPVLYSFRRCPYAMRARLALAASGLACELREIKLSAKPEAMLAASPKGTVPVMVKPDGEVLEQSLDIMFHALETHDPEDWLARRDDTLIAHNDSVFKHHLDRYKYPERHGVEGPAHRESGLAVLSDLNERLSAAPFLDGPTRGLTDAAILPFVRQFAAVDAAWFAAQPLPHVQRWLDDYLGSPLFATIMLRVPVWTPGTEPVVFARP